MEQFSIDEEIKFATDPEIEKVVKILIPTNFIAMAILIVWFAIKIFK